MGCGASKDKNSKRISDSFELIGFPNFDAFFEDAQKLLENAEEIRSGVIDSKKASAEISHTFKLKDPKYIDVAQVLLWSISAENGGKIIKADIDVTSEAPFLKLDKNKLNQETYELYESFSEYLETIVEAPEKLAEIVEKLDEMSQKGENLIKDGKVEIQNSEMKVVGKAKAISQLIKNVEKLGSELSKCRSLQEVVIEAKRDVQELIPKFKDLVSEADGVGAKAHVAGIYTPGEIFDRFHAGLRRNGKKPKAKKEEEEEEESGNESYSSSSEEDSDSEEEEEDEDENKDKKKKKKKGKKSKKSQKDKKDKKDKKKKKEKEEEKEKDNKEKKDKTEPEKKGNKESEEKVHKIEVKAEDKYKIETKEYGNGKYQDRLATDDIWAEAKTEDSALRVPSSFIGSKTLSKIDIKTKSNIMSMVQIKSKGGLGI